MVRLQMTADPTSTEATARRRRPLWTRLWPIALLAAATAAALLLGLHRFLTFDALQAHREALQAFVDAHTARAALAGFAIYVAAVALSIPGAVVLTIGLGFLFGTLGGGTIAAAGAMVGATAVFLLARGTLGAVLSQRAGAVVRRMEAGCRKDAFSYLLALRLVPIFPFWLVNLAPALLGVPTRTYMLATLIGILPGTFVFAAVGAGLGSVLESGGDLSAAIVLKPKILIALGGLAALALVPVAYRRLRRRR